MKNEKTSLGMEENLEAALSYILGFVTGIIFFVLEKKSKFVRFHAFQSTIASLIIILVIGILSAFMVVPVLNVITGAINCLIGLGSLALFIILIIKAYNSEKYKLPFIGDLAEKYI